MLCTSSPIYQKKFQKKILLTNQKKWAYLLNKIKLYAHKKHNFNNKIMKNKKVNYIKINIFPDGGISRIRAFGKIE
jgi:Allantoicase